MWNVRGAGKGDSRYAHVFMSDCDTFILDSFTTRLAFAHKSFVDASSRPMTEASALVQCLLTSALLTLVVSSTDEIDPYLPGSTAGLWSAVVACVALCAESTLRFGKESSALQQVVLLFLPPLLALLVGQFSDARSDTDARLWSTIGVAAVMAVSIFLSTRSQAGDHVNFATIATVGSLLISRSLHAMWYAAEYAANPHLPSTSAILGLSSVAVNVDSISASTALGVAVILTYLVYVVGVSMSDHEQLVRIALDVALTINAIAVLWLLQGFVPLLSVLVDNDDVFSSTCAPVSSNPSQQCPVEVVRRRRAVVLLHPIACSIFLLGGVCVLALCRGPSKWSTILVLPIALLSCAILVVCFCARYEVNPGMGPEIAVVLFLVASFGGFLLRGLRKREKSDSDFVADRFLSVLCAAAIYVGLIYDCLVSYAYTHELRSLEYLTNISNLIMFLCFLVWIAVYFATKILGNNTAASIAAATLRAVCLGALSLSILLATMLTSLISAYDGSAIVALLYDASPDRRFLAHETDAMYRFALTHYAPLVAWLLVFDAYHLEEGSPNSWIDLAAWWVVPALAVALYKLLNSSNPSLYPISSESLTIVVVVLTTIALPPWCASFFAASKIGSAKAWVSVTFAALTGGTAVATYVVLSLME